MDELDKTLAGVFALSTLLYNVQAMSWKGATEKEKADLVTKWSEDSVKNLKLALEAAGFTIVKKEPALEIYPK